MLQAFQMLMVLRKRERFIENPKLLAQLTSRC
jgi:hypothetical protein